MNYMEQCGVCRWTLIGWNEATAGGPYEPDAEEHAESILEDLADRVWRDGDVIVAFVPDETERGQQDTRLLNAIRHWSVLTGQRAEDEWTSSEQG